VSHDNHVVDGFNKDIGIFTPERALEHYLSLADGWTDPYGPLQVTTHDGVRVVRDDLIVGTKARAADLVLQLCQYDTIVYVQPRVGLAGISVLDVANRMGLRVVLFMPASKRISYHQACCIERGADAVFARIAAMPNLNRIAAQWAQDNNAFFVPLGLQHPHATAALVKVARGINQIPEVAWTAISTGVLSRALQIAWPDAEFNSVAVARNLKAGELGRSKVISEPLPFNTPERPENMPPFPSVPTYDAKVFKYIDKNSGVDTLMWNVGKDPVLEDETIFDRVDSARDW
jgi:hypothetical protein